MRIFHLPLGSIFVAVVITTLASADEARFAKWAKVEFSFRGPAAQGRGEPNPFAVKLDVDFCAPGGRDPGALLHNQRAIDWIERCRSRGRRVLMVGFDEGRPEEDRRAQAQRQP